METIMRRCLQSVLGVAALFLILYAGFARFSPVPVSAQADTACTVVIDPGHGGEDGGAVSADGVRESGLNLDIALRLRDLLQLCGIRTDMVRRTDTAVYSPGCDTISQKKVSDLKNRVKMVNSTPNAILVSIHQNFFEQSKYCGAQTFYGKSEGSKELAEKVQAALRSIDPKNHRECKRAASVYLMENACCPGVLVECGFLSNPEEARLLQTEAYQKKLAAAICSAVSEAVRERGTGHEV